MNTTIKSNFTLMFLHLVTHVWCLILNPADNNVLKNWGTNRKPPSFDRTQHRHVIEDQFCHICNVYVGKYTKHCSRCNKCVADFDHHCKWLNTCIGGRNYICFLLCLASAWVGCLLIALVSTTAPTMYFVDRTWLRPFRPTNGLLGHTDINNDSSLTTASTLNETSGNLSPPIDIGPSFTFFASVSDVTWLTVTMLTAGLTALATALVGHLLFFHIYLVCQGLSTYQLVLRQRELETNPKTASVISAMLGSQPSTLPCSSSCQQAFNCPSKDKPLKNQVSPAMHHHNMAMTSTPPSNMGPVTQVLNEGFSESPILNRSSLPPSIHNSPSVSKSTLIIDHKKRSNGSHHSAETVPQAHGTFISSTTPMPTTVSITETSTAFGNTIRVNPLSTANESTVRASYPPMRSAQSTPIQTRSNSEKSLTSLVAQSSKRDSKPASNSCSATPQHRWQGNIQDQCNNEHAKEQDSTASQDIRTQRQYCWQEYIPQNLDADRQVFTDDKTSPVLHSSTKSLKNLGIDLVASNSNSESKIALEKEDHDKEQKKASQEIQKRWAYQSEMEELDSVGPTWRWSSNHSYPKWENKSSEMLVTRWSFPTNTNQFPTPVQTHEKWTPMLKMGSNTVVYDHHQNLQEVLL